MRAKKWLVIITFLTSVSSLVGVFLLNECTTMGYDISLAIFGSSLIGFIMSLAEYFPTKREVMETLWQEAIKASRAIQRIHYYNPKLPIKLISDCLIEERENLWDESFGFEPNFESRQALIRHLIPAEVVDSLDNEAKDDWYESAMEGYKKQLNEFMDTYISIADSLNLDDLTKYSGDLVFVFPNKKLKTLFYNEIYEKLRGFREKITNEVFHFRSEKNGDGNAAVCVQKLQELNKFFFRTDVTIDATYIFRDKYDALGDSIEKFRAKIYHIEPELEEHWPIYQFLSAKIPSPKADP